MSSCWRLIVVNSARNCGWKRESLPFIKNTEGVCVFTYYLWQRKKGSIQKTLWPEWSTKWFVRSYRQKLTINRGDWVVWNYYSRILIGKCVFAAEIHAKHSNPSPRVLILNRNASGLIWLRHRLLKSSWHAAALNATHLIHSNEAAFVTTGHIFGFFWHLLRQTDTNGKRIFVGKKKKKKSGHRSSLKNK